MAAIGLIYRFASPEELAAYHGLNPSVRQSGDGSAHYGRITKRGRSHARHLLVDAAWQTVRSPGPLRAFYEWVRARRGTHVAAIAVARKLAVLIWHMLTKEEDYAWGRPALMARKLRSLEISAGHAARRGQPGSAYDYNRPERRHADRRRAEQAERAYRLLTSTGDDRADAEVPAPQPRSDNDQAARRNSQNERSAEPLSGASRGYLPGLSAAGSAPP